MREREGVMKGEDCPSVAQHGSCTFAVWTSGGLVLDCGTVAQ